MANDVQRKAWRMVNGAVRSGKLPRPDTLICVDCGCRADGYDHRDYARAYEVDPVCRKCNAARGPGLGADRWKPRGGARGARVYVVRKPPPPITMTAEWLAVEREAWRRAALM